MRAGPADHPRKASGVLQHYKRRLAGPRTRSPSRSIGMAPRGGPRVASIAPGLVGGPSLRLRPGWLAVVMRPRHAPEPAGFGRPAPVRARSAALRAVHGMTSPDAEPDRFLNVTGATSIVFSLSAKGRPKPEGSSDRTPRPQRGGHAKLEHLSVDPEEGLAEGGNPTPAESETRGEPSERSRDREPLEDPRGPVPQPRHRHSGDRRRTVLRPWARSCRWPAILAAIVINAAIGFVTGMEGRPVDGGAAQPRNRPGEGDARRQERDRRFGGPRAGRRCPSRGGRCRDGRPAADRGQRADLRRNPP